MRLADTEEGSAQHSVLHVSALIVSDSSSPTVLLLLLTFGSPPCVCVTDKKRGLSSAGCSTVKPVTKDHCDYSPLQKSRPLLSRSQWR